MIRYAISNAVLVQKIWIIVTGSKMDFVKVVIKIIIRFVDQMIINLANILKRPKLKLQLYGWILIFSKRRMNKSIKIRFIKK